MAPSEHGTLTEGNGTAEQASDSSVIAIDSIKALEQLATRGLSEILEATSAVNALPSGSLRDIYCSYPSFCRIIDDDSDRMLGIISKVLSSEGIRANIQRRQADERFELLQECNDIILERLNLNLDEMAGLRQSVEEQPKMVVEATLSTGHNGSIGTLPQKAQTSGAGSWNLRREEGNVKQTITARLITAKNIPRPQMKFPVPVDNRPNVPFEPRLKEKPNSLKPLAILPEYDDDGNVVSYLHPYEFELVKFEIPESTLEHKRMPEMPPKMDDTEYMYVDTKVKLHQALDELKKHKELAVDVEHHSYRSFQGFTCLVQISSRDKDYLFDTLELREEMHVLNEVFTDPKIVKIFHGADLDVEWLQRDLSLYVVNMFDTHQAARTLNMARLSLAFLLKHFCQIDADKTFQLADWRMRPLPKELVDYARQDTHYLIYIYECIFNALLDAGNGQTNLLKNVFQRSTEICKKRYVKPTISADSHLDVLIKSKRVFDNRQLFALREVFVWRDSMARREDESYGYVLPNHMMLQIAESLPREMQGILACCNPVPPLVRQNLHALHQIILKAREQPLVNPIVENDSLSRMTKLGKTTGPTSKFYCPHEMYHKGEFRDDLPTLLDLKNEAQNYLNKNLKDKTAVDITRILKRKADLAPLVNLPVEHEQRLFDTVLKKIVMPYRRYMAMLPIAEKEKRDEVDIIEAVNRKRKLCPDPEEPSPEPKKEVTETPAEDNDPYSVPVKEILRRKYEESLAQRKLQKSQDDSGIESPAKKRFKTETPTDGKLKFNNLPANQKATKSKEQAAQTSTSDVESESDGSPAEVPSTSKEAVKNSQAPTLPRDNRPTHGKRKKGQKFQGKSFQSSNKPIEVPNQSAANFDYRSVDFSKFQGGAKRIKVPEIKGQFHGKGNPNKNQNKKFNKLFTFSNVKSKK